MRSQDLPLSTASRLAGTTPATVRRYAGAALSREGDRYRASRSDRFHRRMSVYGWNGRVDVDVHGSRQASVIGRHHNAVGRYLATGDISYLTPFIGKQVGGVELLTDLDRIEELAAQRELDIDDIYPRT